MKIYNADTLRAWDEASILKQNISSFELMQRASMVLTKSILPLIQRSDNIAIMCGLGNNGGDGICIAKHLISMGYSCQLFELEGKESQDKVLAKKTLDKEIVIEAINGFNSLNFDIIIDALFGFGLNRPLGKQILSYIHEINASNAKLISIDLPSGMPADEHTDDIYPCIQADYTLSIQKPKLSFFSDEYASSLGKLEIVDIHLDSEFEKNALAKEYQLLKRDIVSVYKSRKAISHKGEYGRALILAGNSNTGGAAILSTLACIKSGSGLCTLGIPDCLQSSVFSLVPEAMQLRTGADFMEFLPEQLESYSAITIGPGLGKNEKTIEAVIALLTNHQKKIVWDADALNILSLLSKNDWPREGLFTPHPGEFDRLFGKHKTSMHRWSTAKRVAQEMNWHILLKGANSSLFFPNGEVYFYKGEIPGLAKGGSGDVLTGILCSLLAQGYSFEEALKMGVYLHAEASRFAVEASSNESLMARDICHSLSKVFSRLENEKQKH